MIISKLITLTAYALYVGVNPPTKPEQQIAYLAADFFSTNKPDIQDCTNRLSKVIETGTPSEKTKKICKKIVKKAFRYGSKLPALNAVKWFKPISSPVYDASRCKKALAGTTHMGVKFRPGLSTKATEICQQISKDSVKKGASMVQRIQLITSFALFKLQSRLGF
ncbi:MAG: hypothetical protein AAGI66_05110 [Cyanobacteria bacterium P01_H01_bin.74]